MKKNLFLTLLTFFVLLSGVFLAFDACAQLASIPKSPQGYINDYAGLLGTEDKRILTNYARELEQKSSAQVALVTISSTQPEEIQSFSVRLFDQWKIGQKGKDNGILIVVAVKDRKAWITTGYGLEGAVPDVIASKIVRDQMAPYFKEGRYSQGIKTGTIAVISLVAKEYNLNITGQEARVYQTVHRQRSPLELLLTILFFLFIFSSRSGLLGYFLMGSMLGGRRRGGYWHGAGYGGSGGGFSGGFGGFGGGMTGGGGGGGSW